MRWRPLVLALGAGAAMGALWLGLGGRTAMWLFALATDRPPVFSPGGTLTVALAGGIAGLVGGALLAALYRWLARAGMLRGVLFGGLCYLLAAPGFRPAWPLTFALFAPWFLLYGLCTVSLWERALRASNFAAASDRG